MECYIPAWGGKSHCYQELPKFRLSLPNFCKWLNWCYLILSPKTSGLQQYSCKTGATPQMNEEYPGLKVMGHKSKMIILVVSSCVLNTNVKFRQSPPTIEIELKKQGTKGMGYRMPSYSHVRWDLNLNPKSIITSREGVNHLTWIWSPSPHWLSGRTKPSDWNLKSKCETAVTKVCLVQYNMPAILWHKMDTSSREKNITRLLYWFTM